MNFIKYLIVLILIYNIGDLKAIENKIAFTVENEMMTPTLKIRRHKVREKFSAQLEALYGS